MSIKFLGANISRTRIIYPFECLISLTDLESLATTNFDKNRNKSSGSLLLIAVDL